MLRRRFAEVRAVGHKRWRACGKGRALVYHCPVCAANSTYELCRKNGLAYQGCRSCGHAFVTEPPSAERLAVYYASRTSHHQSQSKLAWDYSNLKHRYHFQPMLERIGQHAPKRTLLDVGCSNGAFVSAAMRMRWRASGVDLEAGSVGIGRERGLDVHNTHLKDMNYEDRSFGAVTLWQLIEHLDDPASLLGEIHRILDDQGVLAMSTPNIRSIGWRLLKSDWHAVEPEVHLHLYSAESLDKVLVKHGFRKISLYTSDIKPETVKRFLKRDRQSNQAGQNFAKFATGTGDFRLKLMFNALAGVNVPLRALGWGEDIYAFYHSVRND